MNKDHFEPSAPKPNPAAARAQPPDVGPQVRPRLRPIALPTEHGGWGFLIEPILLGMLVAPSWAGFALSLAAFGAFLARHPLELAIGDWRRGKRFLRTTWAERFAVLYGLVALGGFGLALRLAEGSFWAPLVLAAPLALVQLGYDLKKRSRALAPEFAGAAALGFAAPAIALAAGWGLGPALVLWAVLMARALPAILYVRVLIRRSRGVDVSTTPALLAHALALVGSAALALVGFVPWVAGLAMGLMLARAVYNVQPSRPALPAKRIGFQELGYGLGTVALVALGFVLH